MKVVTLPPILERIESNIIYEELMTGHQVTHVILDKHEWEEFAGAGIPSGHEVVAFNGKKYSIVKEGYWCV